MIRKLPPDYALWEDVARTVKPLHKAKKKPPAKADIPALGVKAKATPAEPQKAIARPPVSRHVGLDNREEKPCALRVG